MKVVLNDRARVGAAPLAGRPRGLKPAALRWHVFAHADLDTNVLVAAFGFGGICRAIVDVCIDSHELVLSEHILAEVHRHLQGKLNHPSSMADQRVSVLREVAEIVTPIAVGADACRDPDDLPVLGTVLAAKADCLVTGDSDLLALSEFSGHPILSPREFWQRLK